MEPDFTAFSEHKGGGTYRMNYMIDHKNKMIHNGRFSGDYCGLSQIEDADKEHVNNQKEVDMLVNTKGYEKCSYCCGSFIPGFIQHSIESKTE